MALDRDPLRIAVQRMGSHDLARRVQGQWLVEPRFRPSPAECAFGIPFLILHVEHQGCAYIPPEELDVARALTLLGLTVADCLALPRFATVAALDAVYAGSQPVSTCEIDMAVLEGSVTRKAELRASLVTQEAARAVASIRSPKAALVGYSGEIAAQLARAGFAVSAYDFDVALSDSDAAQFPVSRDGNALYADKSPNVIVATGMTLVTNTFVQIVNFARSLGVPLIMYCQTGANLGQCMIEAGASVIVAEHIPFYNWEGHSPISIVRRRT